MLTLLAPALMLLTAAAAARAARPLMVVCGGSAAATAMLAIAAAATAAQSASLPIAQIALQLLTSFLAAIIAGYSVRYLRADPRPRAFAVRFSLLVASLLTLTGADHLLLIGIGLVASSWLLADLIGHQRGWLAARRSAGVAHRTFVIGDAALLAVLAWLGLSTGSVSLAQSLATVADASPIAVHLAAFAVLLTAATRAGVPPFSGWLLGSMTAPTPVSALMHAGFVNGGGLLMIRFAPLFAEASMVLMLAVMVGLAGVVWGSVIQLIRPDVKRALAGSTVAQMGFMLMSCGLGANGAVLWHLVMHGMFKAWLFLGSGQAIGRLSERAVPPLGLGATAAVALATLAAAGLLATMGLMRADLLPVLLALASALATAALFMSGGSWRRPAPLLLVAVLAVVQVGGIMLAERLVGASGAIPGGVAVPIGLLALLLGFWVWQAWVQRDPRRLPPALYVRLLNAGPRF